MTRTNSGVPVGSKTDRKQIHHLNQGKDKRGLPKKGGAGGGNWGSIEDEEMYEEGDYYDNDVEVHDPTKESHIKIVSQQQEEQDKEDASNSNQAEKEEV